MGDMNFPNPNTTTEHDGWDWDSEKWTKWGSVGGDSKPEGYDDTNAIASGAMATGEMVVLNDDGTVSVVEETVLPDGVGTPEVFNSRKATFISSAYDSTSNKIIIAYTDDGNSARGTVVVGTVSGNSITFGAPVVFNGGQSRYISATYDSASNKVVIAYGNLGTSGYGTAVVGTVSGDSISLGTPVVFNSAGTSYSSAAYDPVNSKAVIVYQDNGNSDYGTAVVGTVSGDSITFGAPVVFLRGLTHSISTVYDSVDKKVVITYIDAGASWTNFGTAVVGTVSGDSITFGPAVAFNTASTSHTSITYDSTANKVVIAYADNGNSDYGTAVVGTVGEYIAVGTPVVFCGDASSISTTYDPVANQVAIAYLDSSSSSYGTVVAGTVSGDSISFGTPEVFNNARTTYISTTYDPVANQVVIVYQDNNSTSYGTAVTYGLGGVSTNLTDSNYIGVSTGDYADGSEATVQIAGINDDRQGMTVGKQYIQPDGSLDTTEGTPPVLAGTAISSTELNIKDTV